MGFGNGQNCTQSREALERKAPAKQRRYTFGTHSQTCHVWAQQNEATHTGQSGDGRIRFEGATIYSYGNHFPMARLVPWHGEGRAVLVNCDGYSVSTGQHLRDMRSALATTDISIPVSTEFLKDNPEPRRALIDKEHTALLELFASSGNREALDVFRAIYKPRAKVPADVVAWSKARAALAAKQALAVKVKDARRVAQACKAPLLDKFATVPAEASSYQIEDAIRRLKREGSSVLSARTVLAKVKASRKLIVACSKGAKALKERRAIWEAVLWPARKREAREGRLAVLKKFSDDDRRWYPETELGELWALAIAEGLPVAEVVGRYIQLEQWQKECPETFKRNVYRARDAVLPEDWEAGKGGTLNCYYVSTRETLVRRKGDTLQTSRGAECPFAHAVIAYRKAQACRADGVTWERNGHTMHVGHFNVDRIDADGTLHAGCHTIGFDAMTRLAVREVPELVKACFPVPAVI